MTKWLHIGARSFPRSGFIRAADSVRWRSAATDAPRIASEHPSQKTKTQTIVGSGSDGTQAFTYPEAVALACTGNSGGGPAAVTLEIIKAKMKGGKFIVAGRASSTAGSPPGEVTVELEGDKRKAKTGPLRGGDFKIKQRICDPGRWRATVRYPGVSGFLAATSAAAVVRVRDRQVRC